MWFLVSLTSPVTSRPTGVTIIAILTVILGIMSVFAGISSVILGVFISSIPADISDGSAFIGSVFAVLFGRPRCSATSDWYRVLGYVIWFIKREGMDMDNYHHNMYYWNRDQRNLCDNGRGI